MIKIEFIRLLQDYCKNNNITAYKLSKITGLSNTYCYRLLKGTMTNPSITTINKISKGLGLNIKIKGWCNYDR